MAKVRQGVGTKVQKVISLFYAQRSTFLLARLVRLACFACVGSLVLCSLCSCGAAQSDSPIVSDQIAIVGGGTVAPERVAEIKGEIAAVQSDVAKIVEAKGHEESFWSVLGEEYRNHGMYAEALDAYTKALEIHPNNFVARFRAGLMEAQLYHLSPSKDEAATHLDRAIALYRGALSIDPGYNDAMYGLAVLLVFEKPDIPAAKTLVLKMITDYPNDTRALFLAARIALVEGKKGEAGDWYRRIAERSSDPKAKKQASENLEELSSSP